MSSFSQSLRQRAVAAGYSNLLSTLHALKKEVEAAAERGAWEVICGPFFGSWHGDEGNRVVLALHLAREDLFLEYCFGNDNDGFKYVVGWSDTPNPEWETKRGKLEEGQRRRRPRREDDPLFHEYVERKEKADARQKRREERLALTAAPQVEVKLLLENSNMKKEAIQLKESRGKWKQQQKEITDDAMNARAGHKKRNIKASLVERIGADVPCVDVWTLLRDGGLRGAADEQRRRRDNQQEKQEVQQVPVVSAPAHGSPRAIVAPPVVEDEIVVFSNKKDLLAARDAILDADFEKRAAENQAKLKQMTPEDLSGPLREPGISARMVDLSEGPRNLCRCGQSAFYPFCDMTHVRINKEFGTNFSPWKADPAVIGEDVIMVCGCGESTRQNAAGVRICDDWTCQRLPVKAELQKLKLEAPVQTRDENIKRVSNRFAESEQQKRVKRDNVDHLGERYRNGHVQWMEVLGVTPTMSAKNAEDVMENVKAQNSQILKDEDALFRELSDAMDLVDLTPLDGWRPSLSRADLTDLHQDVVTGCSERLLRVRASLVPLRRASLKLEDTSEATLDKAVASLRQFYKDTSKRIEAEYLDNVNDLSPRASSASWVSDAQSINETLDELFGNVERAAEVADLHGVDAGGQRKIAKTYREELLNTMREIDEELKGTLLRESQRLQEEVSSETADAKRDSADDSADAAVAGALAAAVVEESWKKEQQEREAADALRREDERVQEESRKRKEEAKRKQEEEEKVAEERRQEQQAAAEARRREEEAAEEARRKEAAEEARRKEEQAAEARRKEAAEVKRKEDEAAETRRKEEQAAAAAAAAEARRKEAEEARRKEQEAFEIRQKEEAESLRKESEAREAAEAKRMEELLAAKAAEDRAAFEAGRQKEAERRIQKEKEMEEERKRAAALASEARKAQEARERAELEEIQRRFEAKRKAEEEERQAAEERDKERRALERRLEDAERKRAEKKQAKTPRGGARDDNVTLKEKERLQHAQLQREGAERAAAAASSAVWSVEKGDFSKGLEKTREIDVNTPEVGRHPAAAPTPKAITPLSPALEAPGQEVTSSAEVLKSAPTGRTWPQLAADKVPFCVRLIDVAKSRPEEPAYKFKSGADWTAVTWSRYSQLVQTVAKALIAVGVKRGERVLLLAETRPEWAVVSLATQLIGGVPISVFASVSAETFASIVQEQLPAVLVTDDPAQWVKLRSTGSRFSPIKHIVALNADVDDPRTMQWEELLQKASETRTRRVDGRISQITLNDVSIISYTERTGRGVVLTHANEMFAGDTWTRVLKASSNDRILAFMPFANATERALSIYLAINTGCLVYYGDSIANLHDNMSAVQPTITFSAPFLWERFANVIRAKLGSKDPSTLASSVQKKLRKFIGCLRLRVGISSTAGLSSQTLAFYKALDINLINVYTKACLSGVCTFTVDTDTSSLGRPVDGVSLQIDHATNELMVRGPNVCHAFYGQAPNKPNDWLRSGDCALSLPDGRISFIGREDRRLLLNDGHFVFADSLELQLLSSPHVSGALVVVNKANEVSAVIAIDRESLKEKAIPLAMTPSEYAQTKQALDLIEEHVSRVNASLPQHARIKRFKVLPREFSVKEGECTATMQLNLKVCKQKFQNLIQ